MKRIISAIAVIALITTFSFTTNATTTYNTSQAMYSSNVVMGKYVGNNGSTYYFENLNTGVTTGLWGGSTYYNFSYGTCYVVDYYEDCEPSTIGPSLCRKTIESYLQKDCELIIR